MDKPQRGCYTLGGEAFLVVLEDFGIFFPWTDVAFCPSWDKSFFLFLFLARIPWPFQGMLCSLNYPNTFGHTSECPNSIHLMLEGADWLLWMLIVFSPKHLL